MTIGARVLKTGIAVAFALWLGTMIGLNSPLLASIAAIFTIQPSIYRSWKQVLEQIQSNLLGAVMAIGAVWLVGASPMAVGITCVCNLVMLANRQRRNHWFNARYRRCHYGGRGLRRH